MTRLHSHLGTALLLANITTAPAIAAGENTLTGDWGGARTSLAASGVSLRGDVTGYFQGLIAGDGKQAWDASGRYDALADFDFGKLGLIDGFGFHVHGEGRFGKARAQFGGQLWPANVGAILPLGGPDFAATSLYFTQNVDKRTVLMVGKINALDLLGGDPVFGGWGTQRFMSFPLVAPPSGVVPPTIMGAVVIHKGTPISLTVMVFDPEDRTRDYFPGDLFSSGVNVSVAGAWSGKIAGRVSTVSLTSTVSTKRGSNLEDLLLPPGLVTDDIKGSYNIALQATHRLVDSNMMKSKGLDAVIKVAIADGNPNIIQSSYVVGLVGTGLVGGRPNDSFGAGAFFYDLSNALQDTLDPLANLDNEAGVEAWYNLALTPWFRLTGNVQIIDPANGDRPIAVIGALRANVAF